MSALDINSGSNPSPAGTATDSSDLSQRLAPTLGHLEEQRLAEKRKCDTAALWCLGIAAVWALIAIGVGISNGGPQWWLFVPLAILLVIYIAFWTSSQNAYKTSFKSLVMPELVAQFGDLHYYHEGGLSEHEFNLANLYESPDRFSSEDLIEGHIGATHIRFSEVHAQRRETRRDSKGNTTTHYVTFFRGILFIADFNKQFHGITYILPEGVTGMLGGLGASLQSLGGKMTGRGELIKLEDPEFERHFKVFSTDQVEARYILSSSLMRRFLDLKALYGCTVSAAFMDGSLYLAVETGQNWFESPSLSTPLNFEALSTVIRQLQSSTAMVETLDLNTRIWTKS